MRKVDPKDHEEIMRWWKSRLPEASIIPSEFFPDSGFIVDGKAAVFLYKTNSAVAYIDLLISNPEVPLSESQAALDLVVKACIDEAKKLGSKMLLGQTNRNYVAERAMNHGMAVYPNYYMLLLRL